MGALVQQHAAAFPRPGGPPGTGVIVFLGAIPVGNQPGNPLHFAQLAVDQHFLHLAVHAVGALVKHHGKRELGMRVRGGDHIPHLQGVNAGRLFAHYVQPVIESADGQRRMLIMGGADMHGVHQAGSNQLFALGENRGGGHGSLGGFPAVGLPIGNGGDFNFGALAFQNVAGMAGTHVAITDNAQTNLFHSDVPP